MTVKLWVTPEELNDPTLVYAPEAARAATSILYMLSGRKYPGAQTTTEIYQCEGGQPCNGLSVRNALRARTGRSNLLPLRGVPVRSVINLRVGADRRLIPSDEYRVLSRKYLQPVSSTWGPCSGVEVTYTYGMDPPVSGRRAARVLANELVKAFTEPDDCALPDRVTSVVRQNVSITLLDPQDFLDDGRTGLYEVDLFLKSSNPAKAAAKSKVFANDGIRSFTISTVEDLVIDGGEP